MKPVLLVIVCFATGCSDQPQPADAHAPPIPESSPNVTDLGEDAGVRQIINAEGEKRFVLADGTLAGSGVWRSPRGGFEMEFRDGRKNGIEWHWATNFIRVTSYEDGLKHGTEIIVDYDSDGTVIQWKCLNFANGKPVEKTRFFFPELDGRPPDLRRPFEELRRPWELPVQPFSWTKSDTQFVVQPAFNQDSHVKTAHDVEHRYVEVRHLATTDPDDLLKAGTRVWRHFANEVELRHPQAKHKMVHVHLWIDGQQEDRTAIGLLTCQAAANLPSEPKVDWKEWIESPLTFE